MTSCGEAANDTTASPGTTNESSDGGPLGEPPFVPGEAVTFASRGDQLLMIRREAPRAGAIFSATDEKWRSIASPPALRAMNAVMTATGPVIVGLACESNQCDDAGTWRLIYARYDDTTDAWDQSTIDETVDDAESFAEVSSALGAIANTAYFWAGGALVRIGDESADVLDGSFGSCISGDQLQHVEAAPLKPEDDPYQTGYLDLSGAQLYEHPDSATGDWTLAASNPSPGESVAPAAILVAQLCGSSGPVLVGETQYVVRTDNTWNVLDGGTRGMASGGSSAAVDGRGVAALLPSETDASGVAFRSNLVLIGTDQLRFHELKNESTLPPLRQVASVNGRVVLYEYQNAPRAEVGDEVAQPGDGSFSISYIDFPS